MGRTSKFDRAIAIETCMHAIWEKGFEACSVKAISEMLGITRSSFYNAFGSREALFLEVLNLYGSQTPDQILNDVAPNTSIKGLLTQFFYNVCLNRTEDPQSRGCLAINCVTELVGNNDELSPTLTNTMHSSVERFDKLLNCAVNNGELIDDGKIADKALALQSLLVGLSVLSKVIESKEQLDAMVYQTLSGLELHQQ